MMLIGRLKTISAAAILLAMWERGPCSRRDDRLNRTNVMPSPDRSPDPPVANVLRFIKGIVVDPSGQPISGAKVSSLWTMKPESVTTKADGTFVIPNTEPRLLNLSFLATADGGARQGIFRFQDANGTKGPRTLVRIVLNPARVVTVSVVDGRGAAVEGATVFVLDLFFPVAEARSDARGVATLRAPVEAMTQWIVGYKPGVGFDYFENYRTLPPNIWSPPPEHALLVLNGTKTVRVRAVDSAEKPVPGVEILPADVRKRGKLKSVNISTCAIPVATDTRGIATFDWLPGDLQGATSFVAYSSTYVTPNSPLLDPDKPDALVTAHLVRLTRLSGKVTHPDGSPAPGIQVMADGAGSANPPGWGRATTAADGSYTMDLPPEQSYMVHVVDDEWAAKSLSGVVVHEGQPRAGLDLRLERGCVIRGRVTAGPTSLPAPGLPVLLVEQGPLVPRRALKDQPDNLRDVFLRVADTDQDGRYAFRVAAGSYELTGPRQEGAESVPEKLNVGNEREIERNFRLAARSGRGGPCAELCVPGSLAGRPSLMRSLSRSRSASVARAPEDRPMRKAVLSCTAHSRGPSSTHAIPRATLPGTRLAQKTTTASSRSSPSRPRVRTDRLWTRLASRGASARRLCISDSISRVSTVPSEPASLSRPMTRVGSPPTASWSARDARSSRITPTGATPPSRSSR